MDVVPQLTHLQYHGKMSRSAKAKALKDFEDQKEIKVLGITLGTGSEGLNLAFASCLVRCRYRDTSP